MTFLLTAIARWLMAPLALATSATLLAVPDAHGSTGTAAARAGSTTFRGTPCAGMRVIAHRGHHRRHVENTLRAARAAVHRGADAIEVDLRTTRDNRVVLMHDRTLGRTTRSQGRVGKMTGRQVHAVRTKDGQRVPYAVDFLRFLRHHPRIRGVLELKRMTRGSMIRLRSQLVRTRTLSQVSVTSARRANLRQARRIMPRVHRVRVTWEPVRPRVAKRFVHGVMLPLHRLSQRRVDVYQRRGLTVGAMTVDRPREWQRILDVGVRTVSTNSVPAFRRFCARRAA